MLGCSKSSTSLNQSVEEIITADVNHYLYLCGADYNRLVAEYGQGLSCNWGEMIFGWHSQTGRLPTINSASFGQDGEFAFISVERRNINNVAGNNALWDSAEYNYIFKNEKWQLSFIRYTLLNGMTSVYSRDIPYD